MQILRFSLPYYNPTLPNLAPSIFSIYPAQTGHSQKLLQHPSSKLSFDDSKNVSALRCSQLNCSRIVTVRCGMAQHDDGFYMRRCVELAKKAIGYTSPNPLVGCVIVKDGKIVGEGFHPKAGQPHAEVFALRDAGDLAENATAYVTLEPCNHYGRTPPCTEALLKAKVKKVVVGMVDPNPIVASKGLDKLRAAGLEVTVGVEEELCRNMNEAYIHQMLTGKPFVALRYSMSLNGHVLDQLGEGAADSGGYYSKLLQEYDVVITSSTLLSKKQSLPTSQEPGANQPLRVIISRGSDFGDEVPVSEPDSKLIIFADKERGQALGSALNGIETVVLDQIGMNDILEHCKRQGLCSVLLDLRGNLDDYEELLKEGVEKNLLQKIMVEVLPVWDETDVGISRSRSLTSLAKGLQVRNLMPRVFNQSTILEGHIST